MKTEQNFTIDQMRNQIKEYADMLSPETIPTAYDFLADLADKESEAATAELLAISGLMEDIEIAEKDIAKGNLTDWRKVRSDV